MPEFEYRFVNPKTGRKNKGKRRAFDEAELRDTLSWEGVETDEITRLPDPAATERQLELLVDRGVSPPSPLTMREASDLITNLLERRVVADQEDFRIAAAMRTEVSRFASKAAIYRSILHRLVERNSDADLGAWYAYRVYRNAMDRKQGGIRDPFDARFRAIGMGIAGDERLVASLRRMAGRSQVHFRWFGKIVTPDGYERHGDGDQSEVYRFALGELFKSGLLSGPRQPEVRYLKPAAPAAPTARIARNVDAGAFAPEPARVPARVSGALLNWAMAAIFALLIVWLLK